MDRTRHFATLYFDRGSFSLRLPLVHRDKENERLITRNMWPPTCRIMPHTVFSYMRSLESKLTDVVNYWWWNFWWLKYSVEILWNYLIVFVDVGRVFWISWNMFFFFNLYNDVAHPVCKYIFISFHIVSQKYDTFWHLNLLYGLYTFIKTKLIGFYTIFHYFKWKYLPRICFSERRKPYIKINK